MAGARRYAAVAVIAAGSTALLLVDLRLHAFAYGLALGATFLASTGVAIAALLATVVFAGPPCLVTVAGSVAGACSLVGTAAVVPPPGRSDSLFSFAETAALLVLLAVVGLRAPARWAALPGTLLVAAVMLRPLAGGATEIRFIVALVFALVATIAAASGAATRPDGRFQGVSSGRMRPGIA